MKRIVLDVEDTKHQAIKEKAVQQQKTMRQVLMEMIEKWLKK